MQLFDHLTVRKKWRMFNWIANDTQDFLEPFTFADLYEIELFEIELFDYVTMSIYKMWLYVKTWFGIE